MNRMKDGTAPEAPSGRERRLRAWHRLSIRSKQLVFYGIIIFLVSVISIYSHRNAFTFLDRFNGILTGYFSINQLLVQVQENRTGIERYMRDFDRDGLEQYERTAPLIRETLARVDRESNRSLDTYFLLNAINNSLSVYFQECSTAIMVRAAREPGYYSYYYNAFRISRYIEGYIQELIYVRLSEGNWDYRRLSARADWMRALTLVGLLGISGLSIAFALLFSSSLTRPIRKLADASRMMAEGNLAVTPIRSRSLDEVGTLTRSFNMMSESIRRLVHDLREKADVERRLREEEVKNVRMAQNLREAQFLSLQSQINPHFLFNTLNAIGRSAMFEGADRTTKLIQSLSDLFRYNLRDHHKSISLAEELAIVREYAHIQEFRFGERISFAIRCDIDAQAVAIPCFTLQPLVENAVVHGLEPKEAGGTLAIRIDRRGGNIRIRIHDSGIGIPRDALAAIRRDDSGIYHAASTGIGVANVAARLSLFFHGAERFRISSREGSGTLVSITFPQVEVMDGRLPALDR